MRKIFTLVIVLIGFKSYSTIFLIGIDGCSFNPSSLNIFVGDTIRWYLDASSPRKTSSMNIPAGAQAWDTQLDVPDQSFDYIPTVAGDYFYKSNILPTCIAHFKVAEAVGIMEFKSPQISCSFFPNPVKKEVLIIHPKNCSKANLTTLNGKVIDSFTLDPKETNDEIDLSSFSPSTYLINILDNKNRIVWSGKIIKTD